MLLKLSNRFSAVLDACVLAPMPLCDTLLRCAEEPALFRVLWSSGILEELRRTLEKFGYSRRQADRRLRAMQKAFPEATVCPSPRVLKAFPQLPDPKDRHVVAAAIHERAQVIVTFNLRHFPKVILDPLRIVACSPDELLEFLARKSRVRMLQILDAQARAIGQTRFDVMERLRHGLPEFVKEVKEMSR